MNYTDKQLIVICQLAKRSYLWKGKGRYARYPKQRCVCTALAVANSELHGTWQTPKQLRALVKGHIGRHLFMEQFLEKKLGKDNVQRAAKAQIQDWRFLMLNNMIKMLKEKK